MLRLDRTGIKIGIFLLASLLSGLAEARTAPTVYKIGVEDVDYPPIFSLEKGRFSGYTRDLLDMFARHEALEFRYIPYPIRRLSKEYEKGTVDGIFPDNPEWISADRKLFKVHYSRPALTFQDAVMVRPDRLGQPLRTLGVIIGFQPWKHKEEIKAGRMRVSDAPGAISLIQMIMSGRVDGGNLALEVARYHLKQMGKPEGLLPDPKHMPLVESHYHFSSIRYPELVADFDQFLQTEQKAVKALQVKYGF